MEEGEKDRYQNEKVHLSQRYIILHDSKKKRKGFNKLQICCDSFVHMSHLSGCVWSNPPFAGGLGKFLFGSKGFRSLGLPLHMGGNLE